VNGVNCSYFKELYIFPLAASDKVPSFISDEEYDKDLEDMLIGVFLTDKEIEPYRGNNSPGTSVQINKKVTKSPQSEFRGLPSTSDLSNHQPLASESTIPLWNTLAGIISTTASPFMNADLSNLVPNNPLGHLTGFESQSNRNFMKQPIFGQNTNSQNQLNNCGTMFGGALGGFGGENKGENIGGKVGYLGGSGGIDGKRW